MNKWFFLAGTLVAALLVYGAQIGKLTVNDVLRVITTGRDPEQVHELKVMAFGDMMLGRYVRTLMNRNGMDYIFQDVSDVFDDNDVLFANLEGPIKGEGKEGGTSMNFAFNEDIAPFLKEYGFDVLSIVNNHALDQGWDGRWSTINALEDYGVGWCGHPTEVDADSVYFGENDGLTYAFVCFNDVGTNLDQKAATTLIEDVKRKVDFIVVSIHWGVEYGHYADKGMQRDPGREFIDAGADAVIGHHPHVVQGVEIYKNRPIFWSLGNFIFDQYWSTSTQEELGVGLRFSDDRLSVKLYPMKSEKSKPRFLNDDEYDSWAENFIEYSNVTPNIEEQIRNGFIEINM